MEVSVCMAAVVSGGIKHLNLRVRDLADSAGFYRELFGMIARRPTPNRAGVLICSTPQASDHPFSIVLTQGMGGQAPSGMDHFAIGVASKSDVDIAFDRAQAMGMRSTQPRVFDGNYQTFIFDPDGYKIEIFAELGQGAPACDSGECDDDSLPFSSYQSRTRVLCREAI